MTVILVWSGLLLPHSNVIVPDDKNLTYVVYINPVPLKSKFVVRLSPFAITIQPLYRVSMTVIATSMAIKTYSLS